MNILGITAFSLMMLSISCLYFYIFFRGQERFMQYWGFSWIAYSASLLALLIYGLTDSSLLLEIRKTADMINILFLLFGTYSFMHRRIPAYWYRFTLYLLLLAVICIVYGFELLSFYLPLSVYQMVMTFFLCYNVLTKWTIRRGERYISALIFFLWGVGKSALSIAEVFVDATSNFYMSEIVLSNIVNFCILTIYIAYAKSRIALTDDMYQTIVEHSQDVMFYYRIKPEPAYLYISDSIEGLTGWKPGDFYQDPRLMFKIAAEGFQEDVKDLFENRMMRDEYPTLELYHRKGQKFWCQFGGAFIHDDSGEIIALVGTMRDVTNMKSTEVELVKENRRRNILLSYISHELRTPITSIAGYLTAIQDGTMSSEAERTDAMNIITAKTMTLKKLIDDLDQLSKFEANQVRFDYEAFTCGDVTRQLIERHVSDAERAGFQVSVEAEMQLLDGVWVIIDLERISQVVSNLVGNAIKYSTDRKRLYLTFCLDDRRKHYMVYVRDEGIGIKDSQLSHIFDRFYRVGYNKDVDVSGHGLGLTLSKEIIEAHQGEIYVESVYGSGTTFSFTIPLYTED